MAYSPSTDNYTLGKGVIYFNQLKAGVYQGERDLGNAPAFTFNVALEKLDHYRSRGGLKAKDKEIISQITPGCSFTLDEINKENLALLTLANLNTVSQAAGTAVEEAVTAHRGRRTNLAFRSIVSENLTYNTGTDLFVVGETVTGEDGATGVVLSVTGDDTSGTLVIARTNADLFVAGETLTGGTAGAASVAAASTPTIGNPQILVQNEGKTTTYVEGTDYSVLAEAKDNKIGRVYFLDNASTTLTDGESVVVTYGYAATEYTEIQAFTQTQIEGELRFVSDNPAGEQQFLDIWRCSLTPTGDTAMIGDDWSTLGFAGEILKDEVGHPDSPYMNITMDN